MEEYTEQQIHTHLQDSILTFFHWGLKRAYLLGAVVLLQYLHSIGIPHRRIHTRMHSNTRWNCRETAEGSNAHFKACSLPKPKEEDEEVVLVVVVDMSQQAGGRVG